MLQVLADRRRSGRFGVEMGIGSLDLFVNTIDRK